MVKTTLVLVSNSERLFAISWRIVEHERSRWAMERRLERVKARKDHWVRFNVSVMVKAGAILVPRALLTRGQRSATRGSGQIHIKLNWHLIGHNEGYCSNTGYILLPCFYGIRLWIWADPFVAPRVRRALGTRMGWRMPWSLNFNFVPTTLSVE